MKSRAVPTITTSTMIAAISRMRSPAKGARIVLIWFGMSAIAIR